jgi:hypothetical protein
MVCISNPQTNFRKFSAKTRMPRTLRESFFAYVLLFPDELLFDGIAEFESEQ